MSIHIVLYARFGQTIFKVDTANPLDNGQFVLRPVSGRPYQFITATSAQLKNPRLFRLFPIVHVNGPQAG